MLGWTWLDDRFAVYRGYKLPVKEERGMDRVRLYTENPAIGQELGLAPHPKGFFTGWVSLDEISELTKETLWGELDGKQVWIIGEEGDRYYVQTREGRVFAAKWGLAEVDRDEWGGGVAKTALSKVWLDVKCLKR